MAYPVTIEVCGEKAPFFMALMVSCFKPGSCAYTVSAGDFETERLFLRARSGLAESGSCKLMPGDCSGCFWELKSTRAVHAVFRIKIASAPGGLEFSVPGDAALEGSLQRLLRNAYDPLERLADGTYRLSRQYAAYVREIVSDCFPVEAPEESAKACACTAEGVGKIGLGARFCLYMILIFVPLLSLVWKIIKESMR